MTGTSRTTNQARGLLLLATASVIGSAVVAVDSAEAAPIATSAAIANASKIAVTATAATKAADKAAAQAAAAQAAADAKAAKEAADAKSAAEAAAKAERAVIEARDAEAARAAREAAARAKAEAEAAETSRQAAVEAAAVAKAAAEKAAKAAEAAKASLIPVDNSALAFSTASAGTQFDVAYTGYVDAAAATGLSGAGRFEFIGADPDLRSWNFRVASLANTSTAPISAARISQYGFNVSPDIASATATGLFDTVDYAGNVPMAGLRDVCFRASAGGSCAGGGNGGLWMGESMVDGFFSLLFDTAVETISLSNFFLRFQSIEGAVGGTSGVGIGGAPTLVVNDIAKPGAAPGEPAALPAASDQEPQQGGAVEVPEPGAIALLSLGVVALGLRTRRRRIAA